MATLLAVTYPDADRAKQAMESVDWSHLENLIRVKAACRISKENGELTVHPGGHIVAESASAGAALGMLVGALVGIPVVGIAVGAAIGIQKARQQDHGLDDDFVASIGDQLEAGGSAIMVLFEEGADTTKAARYLARYGGTVHSADLPPDRLVRFQAALDQANQGASSSGSDATTRS